MSEFTLAELEAIVASRARSGDPESWTVRLVGKGANKVAQKLGEEAVETVIAAAAKDNKALVSESADLLYHLLVVLHIAGIPLSDVMGELKNRTAISGIAEKRARGNA